MYEKIKKNVKQAANQIVENINDVSKPIKRGKGKNYLTNAKGMVHIPDSESDSHEELEKFIDKQVKEVTTSSKKIKLIK